MKRLCFILVAVAILAGCQPQEEVIKSHGIKEVHLVQYNFYYPEDYYYTEGDILEPELKVLGYTSLEPVSGRMEVWDGFFNDSISHYPHGFAPETALAPSFAYLAAIREDQFHYRDQENPDDFLGFYCGPNLFFQVVREDGAAYVIGFSPFKLPEALVDLYRTMDYNSRTLAKGKRAMDTALTRKDHFLEIAKTKLYNRNMPPSPLPPPPPPVRAPVKYTPPPAAEK